MSTVKANNVQVGQSGTATNNFTLYQPSSPDGTVRLAVGNSGATSADVLTANSSGNVGIGVTPSSWSGISGKVFEFGYSGGNAALFQNGVNDTHFTSNAYYSGSAWTYNKTGTATRFYQGSGTFQMHGASSGTAGNAITFTQIFGLSKGNTLFLEGATSQSGTGITFPATQSASSDANTLDDYEEGTWTPSLTSSSGSLTTVSNGTGNYTKIGNCVTVTCAPSITTNGTGSGRLIISGLPFARGKNQLTGASREDGVVGFVFGISEETTTSIGLQKYDATYPGGNGYRFAISITYLI